MHTHTQAHTLIHMYNEYLDNAIKEGCCSWFKKYMDMLMAATNLTRVVGSNYFPAYSVSYSRFALTRDDQVKQE